MTKLSVFLDDWEYECCGEPRSIQDHVSIEVWIGTNLIWEPDPSSGLGVPVFQSDPGFLQGGFTSGGAREFDLSNLNYGDLANVTKRIAK